MEYDQQAGAFKISGDFKRHKSKCLECKRYEPTSPATIGLLCLHGAILWKQENVLKTKGPVLIRPDNWRNKTQVAAAMKYKE